MDNIKPHMKNGIELIFSNCAKLLLGMCSGVMFLLLHLFFFVFLRSWWHQPCEFQKTFVDNYLKMYLLIYLCIHLFAMYFFGSVAHVFVKKKVEG